MPLSPLFRRALAGAAAASVFAMAACPLAAETQAPASAPDILSGTLHKTCLPFNDTQRRRESYDEPLGLLADKIKSFSVWAEIEAGMKANGQVIEGLCPSTSLPSATLATNIRGFIVNVMDSETGQPFYPAKFADAVRQGAFDTVTDEIILTTAMLAILDFTKPAALTDEDIDAATLLNTITQALAKAIIISLAVERAVKYDDSKLLRVFYEREPSYIADISDYHAQAIVAQKQNRDLLPAEHHAFRDKIIDHMLKEPDLRRKMAKIFAETLVQDQTEKWRSDLEAGQPFTPLTLKPYDAAYIADRLKNVPGNLSEHPAVKGYKDYWQQQRAAGQDPITLVEKYIENAVKELKAHEGQHRQKIHPAPAMPAS